jgi:signal transduction histidine kinase
MSKRFASLRVRITLAMLALATLGCSLFAFGIFIAAERLERAVLNRHVHAEFETLAGMVREDPEVTTVKSALLVGFVGRDNPELPAQFTTLESGAYHAVSVGPKSYQVYVGNDRGKEIYVAYDITEWEALEAPVIYIMIGGIVAISLLAVWLGFRASAQVIAPVTALSDRLKTLDPRQRNVRVAPEFSGEEVSTIAESFDRYMERLDGFVEREQFFTAAATHELRTPLAVLQGASEILAEQHALPPAAERAAGRIERATREMREFIEALLVLSREEPQNGFENADCELGSIVRQLCDDYGAIIDGRPTKLTFDARNTLVLAVPPALPTIVISNLLRNAVENTDAGSITLTLEDRTLRVADTGRGIPTGAEAALFERGYTTKRSGGLGLHLVKRICDRFGWRLALASNPGKGTLVSIDF